MSSIKCRNCGNESPATHIFCEECGSPLKDYPRNARVFWDKDDEDSILKWHADTYDSTFKLVLRVYSDEPNEFKISFTDQIEWISGLTE